MRGPDANRVYSQGLSRHNRITVEYVIDKIGGHALIATWKMSVVTHSPIFAVFG